MAEGFLRDLREWSLETAVFNLGIEVLLVISEDARRAYLIEEAD